MKAKCPICRRRLYGPLCPVHGKVHSGKAASLTKTEGAISLVGDDVTSVSTDLAEKIPIGSSQTFYGTHTTVSSLTAANPTEITCSSNHGQTGTFRVFITGLEIDGGAETEVNGSFTATYVSATKFTIPVNKTSDAVTPVTDNGHIFVIPTGWSGIHGSPATIGTENVCTIYYTG